MDGWHPSELPDDTLEKAVRAAIVSEYRQAKGG